MVAAAALLPFVVSCSDPADKPDLSGVRSALERAVVEVDRTDPASARRLERLIADADAAVAAEQAGPFWRRSSSAAAECWQRATFDAADTLRRLRAEEEAERARLEELMRVASVEIETAEQRIGRAGMTGRQAALLSGAKLRLASAAHLAAAGKVRDATDAAEAAMQLAAELDSVWQRQNERFADAGLLALWRSQVADTIGVSRRTGRAAIVIDKQRRQLVLYRAGRQVAEFKAELGSNGLARKRHAGDRATPEGRYRVSAVKGPGATRYHLALLIDYPNAEDRRRYGQAVAAGEISCGVGIGSLIEIHGEGGTGRDWTDGCVALANEDMERLFPQVAVGTPVTIVGTR